ncbi:MAG: redox-sensitive bicupin YhaK (pirin superfamily), partial [Salibacteraceae bacterium]
SEKKMMPANYQHVKNEDFNVLTSEDQKVSIKIIAGALNGVNGKIQTQTTVNAFMINIEEGGEFNFQIPKEHQSMLYLLHGNVHVNDTIELKKDENQMVQFKQNGEGFSLTGNNKSQLLFLSGTPINEKVTSWGPYVMNTQTEIMEAMRDYQQGKMGFLPA